MASSFLPAEISVELEETGSETKNDEKEQSKKSTKDPHLVSTTTGGMENSCHNCLLGFGIVALLIGISIISVYYANDPSNMTLSVLGHSVLFLACFSIVFSCAWRCYRKRRKTTVIEDMAELCDESKVNKIRI